VSLRAAIELDYVEDTFHRRSERDPQWAIQTLENVLATDYGPSCSSTTNPRASEVWLRGYFFNTALLRMAAITEKGVTILWERTNGPLSTPLDRVADYDFWALLSWYEKVFQRPRSTIDLLKRVRTQVNIFKHEHLTIRVTKLETKGDACEAFAELIYLLKLTVTPQAWLQAQQAHGRW
jgi:hypothetical protein